jgi:hypothetical protein
MNSLRIGLMSAALVAGLATASAQTVAADSVMQHVNGKRLSVSSKRKIYGTETESPAFSGCTGNCIRKGSGFYQFYPHQRKGNAGTQTPCPEAWTGYGTLMEELPIEEIL